MIYGQNDYEYVTLVGHKVNMVSKNNLLKINLISCQGNKRDLKYVVQDEMIDDLNGCCQLSSTSN